MSTQTLLQKLSGKAATRSDNLAVFRGWVVDVTFAVLLIAAVLYSVFYLVPKISGKSAPQSILPVLLGTLMPVATVLFLSVGERLFTPAGPRKSLRTWFLHLHITVFWIFVASLTFSCAITAVATLARYFGFEPGLINLQFVDGTSLPLLLGALWLSMIAGDFLFYWYHRCMHGSQILWQIHKVHHTDRELDAITINRDGWLDAIVAAVLIAVPTTLVFKLQSFNAWELGWVTGILATAFTTFFALGHMNVRFQVGKASVFYCSPQVHRIHHSSLPQHWDKNFAFIFPCWDVLFGTYYAPAHDEFPPTGVEGEEEIKSFWQSQTFPLRKWLGMFRELRRRSVMPEVAAKEPQEVWVEQGKTYWWCACGLSKKQPFCDGSHKGTQFLPVKYLPSATGPVRLCVCKKTDRPPLCEEIGRTCSLARVGASPSATFPKERLGCQASK